MIAAPTGIPKRIPVLEQVYMSPYRCPNLSTCVIDPRHVGVKLKTEDEKNPHNTENVYKPAAELPKGKRQARIESENPVNMITMTLKFP